MKIQYLEIVTTDVDGACRAMESLHGLDFSAPEAGLGNARTAKAGDGGLIDAPAEVV